MAQTHTSNNFDFIRFTAAALVWYSHCFAFIGDSDPLTRMMPNKGLGWIGVAIFFVVSGYFITASYENHGRLLPFMRNRLLRIMPALITVVLLSVFVLGPLITTLSWHNYFANSQTWRYLRTLMIFPLQYELPGVFATHDIKAVNGSLWTLQHEMRCYVFIALLGFLGILQKRVMVASFVFFTTIMAYGAYCGNHPPETLFTVRWIKLHQAIQLAMMFCGGSLVYMFRSVIPRHIGLFCGGILLLLLSARLQADWGSLLFDLTLIYMIIYLGFLKLPVLPEFSRFGDFSYGFYLYAFPMQQLTLEFVNGKNAFASFMAMSFILTLVCAVGSWHLVEKQVLRFKA